MLLFFETAKVLRIFCYAKYK